MGFPLEGGHVLIFKDYRSFTAFHLNYEVEFAISTDAMHISNAFFVKTAKIRSYSSVFVQVLL